MIKAKVSLLLFLFYAFPYFAVAQEVSNQEDSYPFETLLMKIHKADIIKNKVRHLKQISIRYDSAHTEADHFDYEFFFDRNGNVVKTIYNKLEIRVFKYDKHQNIVLRKTRNGCQGNTRVRTKYKYNSNAQVAKQIRIDHYGKTESKYKYDCNENLLEFQYLSSGEEKPFGLEFTETYHYDGLNRLAKVMRYRYDGKISSDSITYNKANQEVCVRSLTSEGQEEKDSSFYDDRGRKIKTMRFLGGDSIVIRYMVYDEKNRVIQSRIHRKTDCLVNDFFYNHNGLLVRSKSKGRESGCSYDSLDEFLYMDNGLLQMKISCDYSGREINVFDYEYFK